MHADEAEGIGRLGSVLVEFPPERLFASQRPGSQPEDTLCKHDGRLITPKLVMHLLEVRAGTSWILVTDNIKEKPALTSSVLPWFELISNLRF